MRSDRGIGPVDLDVALGGTRRDDEARQHVDQADHHQDEERRRSGPGDQQEQDASCGPEALVVGAVVEEADLKVTQDGAIFEEIELANQQPQGSA